eukprot:876352-Prymnesium_polylepis.1
MARVLPSDSAPADENAQSASADPLRPLKMATATPVRSFESSSDEGEGKTPRDSAGASRNTSPNSHRSSVRRNEAAISNSGLKPVTWRVMPSAPDFELESECCDLALAFDSVPPVQAASPHRRSAASQQP